MKYSIVIPTLNERGNIVRLLARLEELDLVDWEVIVVDEHSADGTADAVREYAAGRDHIRVVSNEGPPGLSPSIVQGFGVARGEFLCCMDGDLQHDPANLKALFALAESCDMVIGSRYCRDGGFAEPWSPVRTLISRTAAMLSRLVLQVRLSDPMSGFFVVRREVFLRLRHLLDPSGFKIMLEIFFVLTRSGSGCTTREAGIVFGRRHYGRSKLTLKVIVAYLRQLYDLNRRCRVISSGGGGPA